MTRAPEIFIADGTEGPAPVADDGVQADSLRRVDSFLQYTKLALDHATDSILWFGPDANFLYVNDTGCRLLGYSAEAFSGLKIFDIDPGVTEDNWPQVWERMKAKSPYTFEARHRRKDGFTFPVEISAYFLRLGDQEIACALSRDITQRSKMEDALRGGEQRFRDFADASSDWFWEMDSECRFSYFSHQFSKITGVPQKVLLGKTRKETGLPGVDPDKWEQHLADLEARRSFRDFRHHRPLSDDRVVHLSINGKAVFDEANNFEGYRGTGRDVTEQVQAEERLRRVNSLFEETERLAKLGHWEWDEVKDQATYCSKELARLHGVTVEEFLERTSSAEANIDWIYPEDRAVYRASTEKAKREGRGLETEYRLSQPGGGWIEAREVSEVEINAAGTVTRSFGFVEDITERRQVERELRQAHHELEQRVAGRTAALSESNLMLSDAIESISEGFIHYDADLRFVRCNSRYLDFYPALAEILKPGVKFEDVVRAACELGAVQISGMTVETWVDKLVTQHRMAEGFHEQHLADGRWVRCSERRTSSGGTVGIRTDITERKQAEIALRKQNHSFRLLQRIASAANESSDVEEALQICLNEVCAFTGWPIGHVYKLAEDKSGNLVSTNLWHIDEAARFSSFARGSAATRFASGVGLPGRVLANARPAWITDVTKDENFLRGKSADASGIRSGMAFPVLVASEVAAVLEFFTSEPSEPDDEVLEIMANIGVQLGRVIERARAEAALRERETMLNSVIENVPMSLCLKDRDGVFTLINPGFERLHGVTSAEIMGKTFFDILPPEVAADAANEDRQVLESGDTLRSEYAWLPEVRNLHELIFKFPLRHHSGGPITGVGVIALDVTEQKWAESELRKSEERLTQAIQLAQLGHCIWDTIEDQCIYCSEEYARVHGVSPEKYMAGAMTAQMAFTHPDDQDAYRTALTELSQGKPFEMGYRVVTPDGKTRYVRELARPILDDAGSVIQGISTIRDITEQTQAEEQLLQAQKMEAVGQLTGGMAHDFNNLLAVILGNLQLIERSIQGDERTLRRLRAALDATDRGAELTQRLLAFARQQPLRLEVVNADRLVADMHDLLKRTLGEYIDIKTESLDALWPTKVDGAQLESAVLNLAINARDAMPEGGKLTIETSNVSLDEIYASANPDVDAGDFVLIAVSDTGQGIPEKLLDEVVQPFFTTKEVGKGSGLGLSMVYGFVKQSGGHLKIYSEVGHGTTVKIYLPREVISTFVPAVPSDGQQQLVGGKETILVVEDDPAVREIAVTQLTELGYGVLEAGDGATALAALEKNPSVDLLFSDIVMPGGMNGTELAERVRSQWSGIKILHCSGYAKGAAEHNGDAMHGHDLISKPYQLKDLARKIRTVLDA